MSCELDGPVGVAEDEWWCKSAVLGIREIAGRERLRDRERLREYEEYV